MERHQSAKLSLSYSEKLFYFYTLFLTGSKVTPLPFTGGLLGPTTKLGCRRNAGDYKSFSY